MWFLRRRRNESGEEAEKALKEAEESLHAVQERSDEVSRVAKNLQDLRRKNHFAEQLEELIRTRTH